MEDLIKHIANAAGLSEETARQALGIVMKFLAKDGPKEQVGKLLDAMPGAKDLVNEQNAGGSTIGGILGMFSGGMGAMSALNELTSAGLEMDQIQTVTKSLISFAKEKAGDDVVDDVINAIPGLKQFI